jgi:hypothetical protein
MISTEEDQMRIPAAPVTTLFAGLALAAASIPSTVGATEEAEYTVVAEHDGLELRRYAPHILAETAVEGEFERAGNRAFGRLFDYISGANRSRAKIDMTAPVVQEAGGERIDMTAPVVQEAEGDAWRVAFVLPAAYSPETAPEPTSPDVTLRVVPERLVAAVRFSGTWRAERFAGHESGLRARLAEHGLEPAGAAVYARYDPPFTPWFLRRNEVLIPVVRVAEGAD